MTDGAGQYRIEQLRPGTYTVTFTLPGFSTVKREGIELAGSFTATVSAELRVGAVEETITVTGDIADRRRPERREAAGDRTARCSTEHPDRADSTHGRDADSRHEPQQPGRRRHEHHRDDRRQHDDPRQQRATTSA